MLRTATSSRTRGHHCYDKPSWLHADAATPAKRLRVRGGYAATPQRSAKPKTGALDQAMVGLQAAERAIIELQGVIAVRCYTKLR